MKTIVFKYYIFAVFINLQKELLTKNFIFLFEGSPNNIYLRKQ